MPTATPTVTGTMDEALLALVVREFDETVQGGYLGRTAVQKLCYFAQALGVPLGYHFRIYYYGPYSDALAFDLEMLQLDEVLVDTSGDRERYSNFRLGTRASALLEEHSVVLQQQQATVRNVAKALGKLDPLTLELLSTLHFVDRKFKAAGEPIPSKSEVVTDFKRAKRDKFSDDAVSSAYDAMKGVGLVG